MTLEALPPALASLTLTGRGGRRATLGFSAAQGELVDVQAYSSTATYGGGGGGSIQTYGSTITGRIEPLRIESETTHHQKLHFASDAGGELAIALDNSPLAFRTGARVVLTKAELGGRATEPVLSIFNPATLDRQMLIFQDRGDALIRAPLGFRPLRRAAFGAALWGAVWRFVLGLFAIWSAAATLWGILLPIVGAIEQHRFELDQRLDATLPFAALLAALWAVLGAAHILRRRRLTAQMDQAVAEHVVAIHRHFAGADAAR